jgi:23S rRNA (adenine-N6)-dimethyltransferase
MTISLKNFGMQSMNNSYSISQNFLKDKSLVNKILTKINLKKDNLIFDIGVGDGIISEELINLGFKVKGFEIDPKLYENLKSKINNPNFTLENEDFLNFNFKNLKNQNLSIFSNIPFNLTTNIIQKILIKEPEAEEIYLIMQEEAANRFLGKKEGLLVSLLILVNYSAEIIFKFKKTDFVPAPKVNIVLMKFIKREKPLVAQADYSKFLDFISYLIMQQKPSIIDRLSKTHNYYALKELLNTLKIEPYKSLYEISKNQFFELFDTFHKKFPSKVEVFKNSYQNYLKVNQKNQKVFKTRTK